MSDPLMLQETREAPQVIRRLLEQNQSRVEQLWQVIQERQPLFAVTIARGSSDHASLYLKYAIELTLGIPVASFAPSVSSVYKRTLNLQRGLVIAISQSGASPDVVESVRSAREGGAITLAITNNVDSPLAKTAEFLLPMQAGPERAVAATKSFVASAAAFLHLLAEGDADLKEALHALPEVQEQALHLEDTLRLTADRYRYASSMVILARGPHFGIAHESALKLKETTGIHAEAYSTAEFSHGPTRIIEQGFPILAYQTRDVTHPLNEQAYQDLEARGADLLTIGASSDLKRATQIITPASAHPLLDPLVNILPFYLFSGHVALARNLNPDNPPHLKKVTLTV
ncbi:SIS domain-containing protein [Deinococcus misasensis]|uniref:SIS domain-containing protein n=1 Tax=Deinococcus misasensis TaxID=392413 RepID=UPI000555A420|nr:SIS domain-containing protein [Deinococcus misasensis]